MKRILLTGHCGFLGAHLRHAIVDAGMTWCGVDTRAGEEFDIRDERADWWPEVVFDACVHLAAIAAPDACRKDPKLAFDTNVRGTHNVLRFCERRQIPRVVFMSSAHTYGVSPKYLPTDEAHPLCPLDVYTVSKVLGEDLCRLFWKDRGISYCAIRLFNAYGPGQSDQFFLGAKLRQARAGGPVTLRNAHVSKDWVHVSDVCKAILAAMGSLYVGEVNVGTGVETSLEVLARQIADGFEAELVPETADGMGPSRMCANIERAAQVLGWKPTVDVKDGIARLIYEAKRG